MLDSVAGQEGVATRITVRDDGSVDTTPAVLAHFARGHALDIAMGHHVGVPQAYFELLWGLRHIGGPVAFADQDDVWLPHKLARAHSRLARVPAGVPAVYGANAWVTDDALRPLRRLGPPPRGPSLENALVENVIPGCTMVLNPAAVRLLTRGPMPRFAVMHDAWVYLVLAATGMVLYDETPVALYRQHPENTLGLAGGSVASVVRRLRAEQSGAGRWTRQADEVLGTYGDLMPAGRAEVVRDFILARRTRGGRVRYALTGAARRQTASSGAAFRLLYALGRV